MRFAVGVGWGGGVVYVVFTFNLVPLELLGSECQSLFLNCWSSAAVSVGD